jgi:hypothetical protein
MTMPSAALRCALYGASTALAVWSLPWPWILIRAILAGLTCFLLERWLRSVFHSDAAFFTALGLSTSALVTGGAGSRDLASVLLLLTSMVAFFGLARDAKPRGIRLAIAATLSILPTLYLSATNRPPRVSLDNLLIGVFGSTGFLYESPLLWAGLLGLVGLRREKPDLVSLCLAAIGPGVLALSVDGGEEAHALQTSTCLPFFAPGIAYCFERIQSLAARQPGRALVGLGVGLVIWNGLFAEQYRRRDIPSDDTVSFSRVASGSAGLVSRSIGTPWAWPANWIFAARFDTSPDRWDAVAGRNLFAGPGTRASAIEIGDDSAFSADRALLLDGFGVTRTCARGACRDLDGVGRILLPLGRPSGGDLVIRVRARGEGDLRISLNGSATMVSRLGAELTEATLRVPARLLRPGFSVLSLSVSGAAERATLDRVTLERDP